MATESMTLNELLDAIHTIRDQRSDEIEPLIKEIESAHYYWQKYNIPWFQVRIETNESPMGYYMFEVRSGLQRIEDYYKGLSYEDYLTFKRNLMDYPRQIREMGTAAERKEKEDRYNNALAEYKKLTGAK